MIDPRRLGSAKDPDAYALTRGIAAWRTLLGERECAIAWCTYERLAGVGLDSAEETRRKALLQVGGWLGTLPPRLALEQEDGVRIAADRCGYSAEAAQRAFRARFWSMPHRARSERHDPGHPEVPQRESVGIGRDL